MRIAAECGDYAAQGGTGDASSEKQSKAILHVSEAHNEG